MSFQQGLSGLNASSKNLDVIGNNIANSSTYGAKSSRAEFADVYAGALNGAGNVLPDTRQRIVEVARELRYSPSGAARSLITRRSNMVALIITNQANLYYPELLAEVSQQFNARGKRVLLFTLQQEAEVDRVLADAPRLRWVQALGTGVDNLADLPSFRPGTILTNLHGIHGESTGFGGRARKVRGVSERHTLIA